MSIEVNCDSYVSMSVGSFGDSISKLSKKDLDENYLKQNINCDS